MDTPFLMSTVQAGGREGGSVTVLGIFITRMFPWHTLGILIPPERLIKAGR